MINCRGTSNRGKPRNLAYLAKFSQGMRNQGIISHEMQNFAHPENQVRTLCENKPTPAKSLLTPYKNFADHAKNFVSLNPFANCVKTKRHLRK